MTVGRFLSVSEAAGALGLPGPWTLRRLLGHSTIATTSRYQHVPDALMREATSRMDIARADEAWAAFGRA